MSNEVRLFYYRSLLNCRLASLFKYGFLKKKKKLQTCLYHQKTNMSKKSMQALKKKNMHLIKYNSL